MHSISDIAVGYGRQVEALLERLGARGPVRGAGELLDQVKHLLDEDGQRTVRRFLKLRNKVIHDKPVEMPMPSREEVERAGRAAVAVLEGALAARGRQTNATFRPPAVGGEPSQENERQDDPPGPVYRIRERDGAYEVWVGPAGVWVGAETREALERARLDVEVRLVTRFPRLAVRGIRRMRREILEVRARYGNGRSPIRTGFARAPGRQLSPEETLEAVRLLSRREPVPREAQPPATSLRTGRGATGGLRMRTVRLEGIPATFWVGPAGVLAVAEFPLIANTEAKRVWENSGGVISAIPVVLAPRLETPQGRVEGVLALRDEAAIRGYLKGNHLLDDDEVDAVAGWLGNRQAPVPAIRDKRGRYHLRGEAVAEARLEAPPAFVVELVPPAPPPKPLMRRARRIGQVIWRNLGWRILFLPELVMFALMTPSSPWMGVVLGVLVLRFSALYGSERDDLLRWRRWVLLGVGALEVAFVWLTVGSEVQGLAAHPARLLEAWPWAMMLVPGLLSLGRGVLLSRQRFFAPQVIEDRRVRSRG